MSSPYLGGLKRYTKGNPITHQEFDPVRKWWVDRKENQYAWKISAEQAAKNNYNIHVPNPSKQTAQAHDKDELLVQAKQASKEISELVDKITQALKV